MNGTITTVSGVQMMFDRMLVERIDRTETEGGILLPQNQTKGNEGIVLVVGPGRWHDGAYIPCQPKVGDTIRFASSTKFDYKGKDYLVVDERNVIAIIDGPSNSTA